MKNFEKVKESNFFIKNLVNNSKKYLCVNGVLILGEGNSEFSRELKFIDIENKLATTIFSKERYGKLMTKEEVSSYVRDDEFLFSPISIKDGRLFYTITFYVNKKRETRIRSIKVPEIMSTCNFIEE